MTEPIVTAEKSVQFCMVNKVHVRSKAVQTKTLTRDTAVSPFKLSTTSSFTSPFKVDPCSSYIKPSKPGVIRIKKKIMADETSDSDISSCKEIPLQDSSSSLIGASSKSSESDSSTSIRCTNENIDKIRCLENTLQLIVRKPMMYIGISKECYFLVNLLHKHTHIPEKHILMCLKKIRLNNTFSELEDNFGLSLSYSSKLFLKNIPKIASFLRPFLVKLNKDSIKKTLPISFRHNYYNTSCIIDCLEIDIQKPSKALFQALTWSEYKKNNTIKYLISCTPNGLINYISPGFGGRATDVTIMENCNFLESLEPGTFILADRGFKHIEQILSERRIKLLRPPSVASGSKLSKAEVRQTKIIASLRIHVERVIRRLREFHMLKQHSVVNKNFLRIIDDVIVISCALVNLQDSLIK